MDNWDREFSPSLTKLKVGLFIKLNGRNLGIVKEGAFYTYSHK